MTDTEFTEIMVDKELELVNAPVRYRDLIAEPEKYPRWFDEYALTLDQYKEWKQYFYDHFYDWKPKREKDIKGWFSMFALQYGLRYNFDYKEIYNE